MGGFNTVVGFMFSFFVIAGVMLYSFTSFSGQISEQQLLLDSAKSMAQEKQVSYSVYDAYYEGGRLKVLVKNTGSDKIFFKGDNNYCLDVYVNGNFISRDNYGFYLFSPIGDYYFLDVGDVGVLDIKTNIDSSSNIDVSVIACGDYKKETVFESSYYNWLDESYKLKSLFTIINSGGTNLKDTYFNIILNSSNFDFTKTTQNDLKIFLHVWQNLVLGLNFDNYAQTLDDYSRYLNVVTLGVGSGIASDDPSNTNGIFFDGLNFDGVNDYVRISPHQSLELEKEVTYSAWVKWNGVGNLNQTIFRNGRDENVLKVINDGGVNDNKVLFSLNIGGVKRELYSNSILDSSWHLVTGTYNGSLMELYVDGSLENSYVLSAADVVFSSLSNQIGSGNGVDFFNGSIDDVLVYNIGLNGSEVELLYNDKLKYRDLNFTVSSWDLVNSNASVNVKLPFIGNLEDINVSLYYYLLGTELNSSQTGGTPSAGTPGTISDLAATKGNGEVYLTWSAPSQGDSPITSYTIEYGIGSFSSVFVDDATANVTITNLVNNNLYQFRVYANNTQGAGSVSNTATATPTGTYYMTQDLATNLGIDGTANQGTSIVALAELLYGTQSPSTSACVGNRYSNSNIVMAQEYTPILSSQVQFKQNLGATFSVDTSANPITWYATLIEYNDTTGDVGSVLGLAQNTSTTSGVDTLNLNFNNAQFNISSGNRLKVVINASHGQTNKWAYLCYGVGTQSSFVFDRG